MYSTYHYRIKDANSRKRLERMAKSVNFVWNYCNETSASAPAKNRPFPSGFDLNKLTSGVAFELGLLAQTVQAICEEYATRRKQFKKRILNWRSCIRSLGWIPFKAEGIRLKDGVVKYNKQLFKLWYSRPLPEGSVIKAGSFNQDSLGRWYCNIVVKVPDTRKESDTTLPDIGIDLGLKTLATLSNGQKLETPKFFRRSEDTLAKAQRAHKKRQVKRIHAKIKNQRKDFAHKASTKIANEFNKIFVGNVSSSRLSTTSMAKSVADAGWYQFKTFLAYKAIRLGKVFAEINEASSSVTCSNCLEKSGPSGLADLSIREWTCCKCGSTHDRDTNAALNILRCGRATPKGNPPLDFNRN